MLYSKKKSERNRDIGYLASGDLQRHLASCYRISKQHFGRIVKDVCEVLCTVLKNEVPDWTEQNLVEIANGFENQWNFPNCVGAIDGKHISVKAPPKNGFNSIVLLATCDANYKFTYLDIGAYGSEGDSNIMRSSKFGTSIMNDTCLFPPDTVISKQKIPHFIVGDNAFPLCKRLIKPYSTTQLSIEQRIFNYRLSRARRCIKNAFGILTARWLCLRNLLFCKPERAQVVVSACCLLHNFLTNKCRRTYNSNAFSGFEDSTGNWIAGEWEVLQEQEHTRNRNESNVTTYRGRNSDYGKYIRKILTDYINSTNGPIPLQNNATFV
ncbi:protein ALP1-like isoform X2 [Bactrocera tryoni]|uniref:protein ALP1-like isoform X2 n=1 Tax=Bactrocera tryoni TaxID=59916 RepID=UPI001A97FA0B|nr:protein ALP1-like isoform X2 [Bactrocera tryoni]